MTEQDWKTTSDAIAMLEHAFPMRGMDSTLPQTRKSRMYLAACTRRLWGELPWVCRVLIEFVEQVADRAIRDRSLRGEVYRLAECLTNCNGEPDVVADFIVDIECQLIALGFPRPADAFRPSPQWDPKAWTDITQLTFAPFRRETPQYRWVLPEHHSADLVREVFGNPFQRARFDEAWQTTTVASLTRQMYETRDFSPMPILADALQDADCDSSAILNHCRHPGNHVRGCWVADLILGKDKIDNAR